MSWGFNVTDNIVSELSDSTYSYEEGNWIGGFISVPVTAITAGIFNGNLRDRAAISESLPHWEGVPIIRYVENGVAIHPPEKIVKSVSYVVGKLRDVRWDEEGGRICGNAFFSPELGASEEFMKAVANGVRYGVSAMYFREALDESGEVEGKKYNTRSTKILPNNLAIVDNPACPKNKCGINVEEKVPEVDVKEEKEEKNNLEVRNMSEEITKEYVDGLKAAIESNKTVVESLTAEKVAISEKLVSETAAKVAAETERDALKAKLSTIETEKKKATFLGQFPEANRKMAEEELLPVFMEDASKVVMEHGERFAELLAVVVESKAESKGKEHVPEMSAEEQEYVAMGLPSKEQIMADMGIKI